MTEASEDIVGRIERMTADEFDDFVELLSALRKEDDPEERRAILAALGEFFGPLTAASSLLPCGRAIKAWAVVLGWKVRRLRQFGGLNQKELASAAGLPWAHVYRIENGRVSPNCFALAKIAKVLSVDPSEFDQTQAVMDAEMAAMKREYYYGKLRTESRAEEIRAARRLMDKGIYTRDEFEAQRMKLMAAGPL